MKEAFASLLGFVLFGAVIGAVFLYVKLRLRDWKRAREAKKEAKNPLTECEACNQKVSKLTPQCPGCGHPVNKELFAAQIMGPPGLCGFVFLLGAFPFALWGAAELANALD